MKLHRFYLGDRDLPHAFWMDDEKLFHQWKNVLRFESGREVVLFNNQREVRLYRISKMGDTAAHMELVTELEPTLPKRDVYLCFSLLKKDKNEWVLQKGTELGIAHFVPLICERTEKTGWDAERAEKIVIEAAEQCERADIPRLREPLSVEKIIEELEPNTQLLVAHQGSPSIFNCSPHPQPHSHPHSIAVLIGPEGGWSDDEKQLFADKNIQQIGLSDFTLRAETAAIAAAALLQ